MLRAAIKHSSGADQVRHRTVPSEYASIWSAKLEEIKDEVAEVLKEEQEEKAVSIMNHPLRDSILKVFGSGQCNVDSKRGNGDQERTEYDRA